MCHALLQDPKFFRLLQFIDEELAGELRAGGCSCGGVLHRADYPRKPRGCLAEVRAEFASRLSFCCNRCRKRFTSMSVRFLGRRVYLALAMVLVSARRTGSRAPTRLAGILEVPVRTVGRWRQWWCEQLPRTPFWQQARAQFMPPVAAERLPASVLERFAGTPAQSMRRLLVWLTPLTVGRPVELQGGR